MDTAINGNPFGTNATHALKKEANDTPLNFYLRPCAGVGVFIGPYVQCRLKVYYSHKTTVVKVPRLFKSSINIVKETPINYLYLQRKIFIFEFISTFHVGESDRN